MCTHLICARCPKDAYLYGAFEKTPTVGTRLGARDHCSGHC
ncbi:hypothetical protein [Streptomyces sp. NRRL S-1813]|nr:hypothetical protein [Streptomyces sp. NRRL S-1813]